MSKASISNSGGPGSSISLAPETIRVRDALIEKFLGEPIDVMTGFMSNALEKETNELRRLGVLAARIYLLRHRIANLKDFIDTPAMSEPKELDTSALFASLPVTAEDEPDEDTPVIEAEITWARIQMIAAGEVNGVRFLSGTIIDAHDDDAQRLITSGKAVRIDEDGNIIEHQEDHFNSPDGAEAGAADEADAAAADKADAAAADKAESVEVPEVVEVKDADETKS